MEEKVTIKGKLIAGDLIKRAKLLHLMRNFKDAIEMGHNLIKKVKDSQAEKLITSTILNNAHHSHSALQKAKLYKDQDYLKLRKPQLFSVGKASEKGNRNLRLVDTNLVMIKLPHSDGKHEWLSFEVKFGGRYIPLLKELISSSLAYTQA